MVVNNGGTQVNFGLGTSDTTANTYSGETDIYGYQVFLNKAANTAALAQNRGKSEHRRE